MKNEVIVYLSSVLNLHKHAQKEKTLKSFGEGAIRSGVLTHFETKFNYQPSKLAVILGWVSQEKTTPNILLRQEVVNEQPKFGGRTMCIDAGCWKYADPQNRFLRYSLDGPFYDQAEYANKNSGPEKWNKISQTLGLTLKDWQRNDSHILICMQRDGGFSMKNLKPMQWLETKIQEIRQYSDRPIIIRPHPGKPQDFSKFISKKVKVMNSTEISLVDSLKGAHCAVFFNSSSAVAAVCEGIPIFVDDKSCVAWNVANKSLRDLEKPNFYPREQWIYDLAAAHWSDDEGRSGLIYQKFHPLLA